MANPVLSDRAFEESRVGWAAPAPAARLDGTSYAPARTDAMTSSGTWLATGALFAIVVVTGVSGWMAVAEPVGDQINFPGWLFLPLLAALGFVIAGTVKPRWSPLMGPLYAACEGLVVGAISHVYNIQYNGIVVMAVGATAAVFASMLFMYSTRIIKVTDRMRRTIVAATMGVVLLYLVSFLFSLFGNTPAFINSSGAFGILLSLVIVGIAAFNLVLQFDFIERGVAGGAPKYMEWYAAMGLMVTLIWLYLEMLRLFAKLNRR